MSGETRFLVSMEQMDGYEFLVKFHEENIQDLIMDEPEPLGTGKGPNPSRVLAAAVGSCLSASLLFCLTKSRIEPKGICTTVNGTTARNEKKRLRITDLNISITIDISEEDKSRVARCMDIFEDFCIVSTSVRQGIPMEVHVKDRKGNVLK